MKKYTSKRGKPVEFELDGVIFETTGSVPFLRLSRLARLADSDTQDPAAVAAIDEWFDAALGKDQHRRFLNHTDQHGTDPETLMAIIMELTEAMTSVPTQRPLPSAPGPTSTGFTSKVISPSGEVREEPMTPDRQRELEEAVSRAMAN